MRNNTKCKNRYTPAVRKRNAPSIYKKRHNGHGAVMSPFQQNMFRHGTYNPGNRDVSCLVKREVYVKDRDGNVKVAKETQLFNAMRQIGHVEMHDD